MRFRTFAAALACLAFSGSSFAREITDMTGARTQLVEKPMRVVTLAPSLGELAADLVGSELDRIVGVSEYSDYPPALTKVKSVGNYTRANLEAIVGLRPDLVLATLDGNSPDQVQHLRELKLPVVVVKTGNFKEIEESVALVGQALGNPKEGERMSAQLRTGIEHIRKRAEGLPRRKVLLQVGANPLVVVGRKSFLHEALEAVGGINVYGDSSASYPRPSMEDVVARNPEVVVVMILGKDPRPFMRMAAQWKEFPKVAAVKNGKVKLLKADQLLRPTVRLLEGLEMLEKEIHEPK